MSTTNDGDRDALERLPDEVSETEAAAMLGVGPRTIYAWTQRFAAGDDAFCDARFRFPHRCVRERRYYRKADVERVVGLRADYMTLAQAEVALGLTYRMLDRRVRANLSVPASVRIYGAAMYHVDTLAAWAKTLRLDTHEALLQARRVARLHAVVWPTEHAVTSCKTADHGAETRRDQVTFGDVQASSTDSDDLTVPSDIVDDTPETGLVEDWSEIDGCPDIAGERVWIDRAEPSVMRVSKPPAPALPGSRVREILADGPRGSVIRTVRLDSWVWTEINRLDRLLEPFTGGRKSSAIMRAALSRGLEYDALSRLHAGDLTRARYKTTTTRLPSQLVERVLAAMVDGENEASVTRAAIEIGLPELRAELAKAVAEAILKGESWLRFSQDLMGGEQS